MDGKETPKKTTVKADAPAKVAPAKVVKADGFNAVADKLPPVKSHGPVASSSEILTLKLPNGKLVLGKYQRWDRDMNAPHIQAKKGEGFFHDAHDVLLVDVQGWK